MSNYKILVIDYEPRGIKQLRDPLVRAGHEVTVAQDGVAGIEAFNEVLPDLTLIEAMLPKRHGFEVCQVLKQTTHGESTPVVIVTSVYKGRRYRTQAIHNYKCDEYLEKPIAEEKLLEVVDRLLAGRVPTGGPAPAEAAEQPPVAAAPAAPEAAPAVAPAAKPAEGGDGAEFEIMERLDELLGNAEPNPNGS